MPNFVDSIGPRNARIAIVGEAPGEEEDRQGQPFVGYSGRILDKLLATVGVSRMDCFITNVIKERPEDNDIEHFIRVKKSQTILTDTAQMYVDYLWRELLEVRPNVVIALGAVPLNIITGQYGIYKWRGSVLQSRMGGLKVVPTIHPAASLHGAFELRYIIRHDLERAALESQTPEIKEDHRGYIIKPDYKMALGYLEETGASKLFAYDIEAMKTFEPDGTELREVSCISFSHRPEEAISIPFFCEGYNFYTPPQELEIWRRIKVLLGSDTPKVAHNAGFDATFLFQKYGIVSRNLHDSMIAIGMALMGLPSIVKPKSLAFLTSWFTDLPYYKDDGKENFDSQDNTQFFIYNAKDSVVLMEAFPQLLALLDKYGLAEAYEKQRSLLPILTFMTAVGMRVDQDYIRRASMGRGVELNKLEARIAELVGRDLNPSSSPQLQEYFYDELGIKPYLNRKTGNPTLDEKALKRIASTHKSEVAALILEHRGISKMKGTYFDMDLDTDGRLRSSMNPIGTWTGRLSSSKTIYGTGGNLQTLPKIFKGVILPDPGYVLYEVDLGQAENRIVAYIAPELSMIDAFESGADIHSRTAARMFNLPEEQIAEMNHLYEATKGDRRYCADIGQGNRPHRYWGKQANHALNYGLGYGTAALRWEISQNDAKRIRELYLSIYPGVTRYWSWVEAELKENRRLTNLFNRTARFIGDWQTIRKQGFAFIPQSTVADIINRHGLIYLYESPDHEKVVLLNQVHDSLVFQIPLSAGWEYHETALRTLTDSLERPLHFRGRTFNIPAEVTLYPERMTGGVELYRPAAEELEEAYTRKLELA